MAPDMLGPRDGTVEIHHDQSSTMHGSPGTTTLCEAMDHMTRPEMDLGTASDFDSGPRNARMSSSPVITTTTSSPPASGFVSGPRNAEISSSSPSLPVTPGPSTGLSVTTRGPTPATSGTQEDELIQV